MRILPRAAALLLVVLMLVPVSQSAVAVGGDSTTVRIFSVNVCIDQDNITGRGSRMMDLILSYEPDSVGTQENGMPSYSQWPGIFEAGLKGYGRVGLDDGGGHNSSNQGSNYIYYNESKYECLDWQTFWMSDTTMVMGSTYPMPWAYAVTWGLFRNRANGSVYAHVNCHLSAASQDEVRYQVRFVEEITRHFAEAGIPVFTTGDFNTSEGGDSYSVMTESSYISDAKFTAEESMDYRTWRGWSNTGLTKGRPIDFCFVSDGLMRVKRYSVVDTVSPDGVVLSDHCALYVEAELDALEGEFPNHLSKLSMGGSSVSMLTKSQYLYDFEFTAPSDRHLTYYYRADLYDAEGNYIDSRRMWSLIFDKHPRDTIRCTFTALDPGTQYTVKLYACTAAGQYSDPMTFEFTTFPEMKY